ncbi:hypothetical protein PINS_up006680 [Pythium insidiosum]|nr:hypothetical protein PINS_up006680 [Pythium insidiosum]
MPPAFLISPFARLQLSSDDSDRLHDIAQLFVDNALSEFQSFLAQQRHVEAWRWKLVRRKDGVNVYQERAPPVRASQGSSSSRRRAGSPLSPPIISVSASGQLPRFQTVGMLAGTVNDCMFGAVHRVVDAHDAAVLATIVEPSSADPFLSLAIKWVVDRDRPLPARAVAKTQDFVYLEYTGLTTLPMTDEVVGFHLVHSVSFPQTPQLPAFQRGTLSSCTIFRQHTDDSVELFSQGFMDPTRSLFKSVALRSAARVMTAPSRVAQLAQRKKMEFAWRHRQQKVGVLHKLTARRHTLELLERRPSPRDHDHTHGRDHAPVAPLSSRTCAVCDAVLVRGVGSLLPFQRKRSAVQCRLCLHETCVGCQITQSTADGDVSCCVLCVSVVAKLDAIEIAAAELSMHDRGIRSFHGESADWRAAASSCCMPSERRGGEWGYRA